MHIDSLNSIPKKDFCKPKELCSKWLIQTINIKDPENKTLLRLMADIEREYSTRISVPEDILTDYNRYRVCLLPNSDTPFFKGEPEPEWEDEKYYTGK